MADEAREAAWERHEPVWISREEVDCYSARTGMPLTIRREVCEVCGNRGLHHCTDDDCYVKEAE